MRTVRWLIALALFVVGLSLAVAVLYDATELTRLAGLSPERAEAAVALAGVLVAFTLSSAGAKILMRPQ